MAFVIDSISPKRSLSDRLRAAARGAFRRASDHYMYHRTIRELQALDARTLADLGLNRSAIRSAARETVYGHQD